MLFGLAKTKSSQITNHWGPSCAPAQSQSSQRKCAQVSRILESVPAQPSSVVPWLLLCPSHTFLTIPDCLHAWHYPAIASTSSLPRQPSGSSQGIMSYRTVSWYRSPESVHSSAHPLSGMQASEGARRSNGRNKQSKTKGTQGRCGARSLTFSVTRS